MLAQLKPGNLIEHVGTQFDVLAEPARPLCLTLTRIVEYTRTDRQEIFSLYFHGPTEPLLRQGTYQLKHAQLGELELFLVPVGKDKDGFEYEAAFNNMI